MHIHKIILISKSAKINSEVFKILCSYYDSTSAVKSAIEYFILHSVIDNQFVTTMFECSDVIPDYSTVNYLLSRYHTLSNNNIMIIIETLKFFGLKITKQIVLRMLDFKLFFDSIDQYNIIVDQDIYLKQSYVNIYPYKLGIIPTDAIMHQEILKKNNFDKIKELVNLGGIIKDCCLKEACKISNNLQVVKYFVEQKNVLPSNDCIKTCIFWGNDKDFSLLDYLLKFYDLNTDQINGKVKKIIDLKKKQSVEETISKEETKEKEQTVKIEEKKIILKTINNKYTLQIAPLDNIKDKTDSYEIKNKIGLFLGYKFKIITWDKLYELTMKYLINNKLIISCYFVINNDLSKLLSISPCSILHIDQLDNILSYFVKIP